MEDFNQTLDIILTISYAIFVFSVLWYAIRKQDLVIGALLIPTSILFFYFLSLALNIVQVENDISLRQEIVRPMLALQTIILSIHFLNGRINRAIRRVSNIWKTTLQSS